MNAGGIFSTMRPTQFVRPGIALAFLFAILFSTSAMALSVPGGLLLLAGAVIGGYMAMNIGANDVANNVGPAVGSRALTMGWAVVIAGVFEAAGALIAGGDVVGTIKQGIIDPALITDAESFVWLMMAALLAGALWLTRSLAWSTRRWLLDGTTSIKRQ